MNILELIAAYKILQCIISLVLHEHTKVQTLHLELLPAYINLLPNCS